MDLIDKLRDRRNSEPPVLAQDLYLLATPVDAEALPIGAILDGLDDKNVLNSRNGELYTFPNLYRYDGDARNLRWTTLGQRKSKGEYSYRFVLNRAQLQCYSNVSLENCLEAVEVSAEVQAWFKATGYNRPAYLVTGRQTVPLPTADNSSDGPVGILIKGAWADYGDCSATTTVVDGKVIAVQLTKLEYKKRHLVGHRKLVCENCRAGDYNAI